MATEQHTEPPFDGHPCPACPSEVRDLYAVAFNLLNIYRSNDWERLPKKLAEFRRSVERFERIVDGHFARPEHSHPPREGYTTAQPRPAAE